MKRAALFICVVCWAVPALSLAAEEKKPNPPVAMSTAGAFGQDSDPTTKPLKPTTTTMAPKKTTTTPAPKKTTTTLAPKKTTTTLAPKKTTTTLAPKKTTTTPAPKKTTTTPAPKKTTTTPAPKKTTTTLAPKKTTTTLAPKKTTTTLAPKKTTTTLAPKKTTTTPPPKPKTTTPPPKPKTTTPPPKPKTTTTPPKPKTTTTPPKPTTKPTPPPPPKPTPPTNLTVGNYTLMADKKVICLMAQMALQIRLVTPKANGTFIVQPKSTKAEGSCQQTKANLTLVFKEGFITFMFNKSTDKNTVYVDALSFDLSYPLSKEVNLPFTANNKSMHLFTARIGHSYSCKGESLYMGNGLYLDVNQDRMQAFNLTKSNEFGTSDSCAADKPDYRVAIAVGVTLLVLIIIVVVAYLLGRRRRADGYQSL